MGGGIYGAYSRHHIRALGGDKEALLFVLQFYEARTNSFAHEKYRDEYGNMRIRFDSDAKEQLQEKLIKALQKFDFDRASDE